MKPEREVTMKDFETKLEERLRIIDTLKKQRLQNKEIVT